MLWISYEEMQDGSWWEMTFDKSAEDAVIAPGMSAEVMAQKKRSGVGLGRALSTSTTPSPPSHLLASICRERQFLENLLDPSTLTQYNTYFHATCSHRQHKENHTTRV